MTSVTTEPAGDPDAPLLSVTPNPVRERCEIRFQSSSEDPVEILLTDVRGRTLRRLGHSNGIDEQRVDLFADSRVPALEPGVYFIVARGRDVCTSRKFVKLP